MTVLGTIFLLLPGSAWLTLAVSTVMTFNHPAAWFLVPALLALRFLAHDRAGLTRQSTAAFLGLLAGSAMAKAVTLVAGITPYPRWRYILDTYWTNWLDMNFSQLPLALYSFHFALWLPVVTMLLVLVKNNRALALGYLLCLGMFYGVTFFCDDTTRVFALLSWAPTLYVLLYTWQKTRDDPSVMSLLFRLSLLVVACFGWLAPHLFIWKGAVYMPGFANMRVVVAWLCARLGGA